MRKSVSFSALFSLSTAQAWNEGLWVNQDPFCVGVGFGLVSLCYGWRLVSSKHHNLMLIFTYLVTFKVAQTRRFAVIQSHSFHCTPELSLIDRTQP